MVNTCAIWGTTSYVNSWLWINILVIVISLLAIAVAYSLSSFFPANTRGRMRGFVRFEMIQMIISIAIIGVLLGFSAAACSVSSSVSQSLSHRSMDPFQYADYYIGSVSLGNGLSLLSNMYSTSVQYAIYASVIRTVSVSTILRLGPASLSPAAEGTLLYCLLNQCHGVLPSVPVLGAICNGKNFCDYERTPSSDLGQLYDLFSSLYLYVYSPIIVVAVGLLFIQFLALPVMQYTAFTVVLPIAIGMRSISFFGTSLADASNALIALAVAFYLIYPMTVAFDSYAISWVFSANNPAAQYAGTAFTVNQVTTDSFFQSNGVATNSIWTTFGSLKSFFVSAFPGHGIGAVPFIGLVPVMHTYTNQMAQFVFESILLFALNISITVGLAVSLYKALKSGLGEAGRFW